MAVERTGTAVSINTASATGSQSITVPGDATLAIIFFGGAKLAPDTGFDSGGATFSVGGGSASWVGRSANTSEYADVCAYSLASPATGTQTFSWTVDSAISYGYLIVIVFYRNTHPSVPVGSVAGACADTGSIAISGLTVATGDMTVGACCAFYAAPVMTGNSQTSIVASALDALQGAEYMTCAEKAESDTLSATYSSWAGMVAVVVKAQSVGAINQHSFRVFNDDGSESASTEKAALNTNINVAAGDVFRVRFLLDAAGDPAGKQFRLECRKKPSGGSFGEWGKVN